MKIKTPEELKVFATENIFKYFAGRHDSETYRNGRVAGYYSFFTTKHNCLLLYVGNKPLFQEKINKYDGTHLFINWEIFDQNMGDFIMASDFYKIVNKEEIKQLIKKLEL